MLGSPRGKAPDASPSGVFGLTSLDCGSPESALSSVALLIGADPLMLRQELRRLRLDDHDNRVSRGVELPHDVLWSEIVGPTTPQPLPDAVVWFHGTRVPRNTTFEEGLQPLGVRLPQIRESLHRLMVEHGIGERDASQPGGNSEFLLNHKSGDPMLWGPFGQLVRESVVRPTGVIHDYLRAPEIVEDLAGTLAGSGGARLLAEFRRSTVPCVVSFSSTEQRGDVAAIALLYCYLNTWGCAPDIEGNTCYDGGGRAISSCDIIAVDFLDDPSSA